MQVPGDEPLIHRKHGLDQARHPGGGFQVADIRFHRTDQQRTVSVPAMPVCSCRRIDFDRVAHLRSCAVCLKIVDVRGPDTGPLQCLPDHPFLCRPVRNGEARACTVLVQGRAADDTPDAVACGLRVGEPFQHHHAAAFTPDISVGGGVEGLALAIRGQHPGVGTEFK